MLTPEEAAGTLCPLARCFALPQAEKGCRGPSCACWRWEKVTTDHPAWKAAMSARIKETGEKAPFKDAAAWVVENKVALGLIPARGFCGIGGAP